MRTVLAAIALALVFAACSHGSDSDRDPGSGIRDLKNTKHESRPSNPESRSPNPDRPSEITLTPDMIQRAGIKTVAATKGTTTTRLHLPGVVQPNAYKNVDVTSLVSGRLVQVKAELGQRVMQNEVLATVYSPELADAQTGFIEAKAARDAHGLALTRTQRRSARFDRMRKPTSAQASSPRRIDTASAMVLTRLAPMASRTST